jgi:photosystem II stability/assembly factor-like uncharacterized protein
MQLYYKGIDISLLSIIRKINFESMNTKMKTLLLAALTTICANTLTAQWIDQTVPAPATNSFVTDVDAVDSLTCWGLTNYYTPNGASCPAASNKIIRTVDGGATWQLKTISSPGGFNCMSICALSANEAWVATCNEFAMTSGKIMHTTDGGNTWSGHTSTFTHGLFFIHFFNVWEGVAIGGKEVYTTTDGGTTWQLNPADLPNPFTTPGNPYYPIFLRNSIEVKGSTIWIGDTDGVIYKSTNKGLTWTASQGVWTLLVGNSNPAIKGIAFKDEMNGYAIYHKVQCGANGGCGVLDEGHMVKTTDGGDTWSLMDFDWNTLPSFYYYAKHDIAYVPGTEHTYLITAADIENIISYSAISYDNCTTWTVLDSAVKHTTISFVDSRIAWTGSTFDANFGGMFRWDLEVDTTVSTGILQDNFTALHVSLYPNPANSDVNLQLHLENTQEVELSIYNIAGQLSFSTNWTATKGASRKEVDISSLAAGVYYCHIKAGNKQQIIKLMKQ